MRASQQSIGRRQHVGGHFGSGSKTGVHACLPPLALPILQKKQSLPSALCTTCRYELWRPFLEGLRRQGKAAGVVLADAGDVLLQADPWQDAVVEMLVAEVRSAAKCANGQPCQSLFFSHVVPTNRRRLQDALLFSLEGGPHDGMGKPIRDCAANRQCLQRCFGAGAAEQLGGKPIACAGEGGRRP